MSKIDINQVLTGTIDSICEQLLRDYRDPGTQPPILIDAFVGKTLLLREGLFNKGRYKDTDFDDYLYDISGRETKYGWHIGAKHVVYSGPARGCVVTVGGGVPFAPGSDHPRLNKGDKFAVFLKNRLQLLKVGLHPFKGSVDTGGSVVVGDPQNAL